MTSSYMPKKYFTATFWFMLIQGMITGLLICLYLYMLFQSKIYSLHSGVWQAASYFFLPVITILEAFMYWMVRKRNIYRRVSWNHVVLFTVANSTIYIKLFLVISLAMSYQASTNPYLFLYIRQISLVQIWLFWGGMILAHIFFVRLFIMIFRKQPEVEAPAETSENLLDNILD